MCLFIYQNVRSQIHSIKLAEKARLYIYVCMKPIYVCKYICIYSYFFPSSQTLHPVSERIQLTDFPVLFLEPEYKSVPYLSTIFFSSQQFCWLSEIANLPIVAFSVKYCSYRLGKLIGGFSVVKGATVLFCKVLVNNF